MIKNNFPLPTSKRPLVKEYQFETTMDEAENEVTRVVDVFTDFHDRKLLHVNQVPTLKESKISGQNLKEVRVKLNPDLETSDRLQEQYVAEHINDVQPEEETPKNE